MNLNGWASLFQQSSEAVFLLNRQRRVRYVNKAWEQLTGQSSENVLGLYCLPRKREGVPALQLLAQTLSPPAEVRRGKCETIRRPMPGAKVGPPWWEISFFPLFDGDGLAAILGKIVKLGEGRAISSGGRGFSEALMAIRLKKAQQFSFDLLSTSSLPGERLAAQARAASETRQPLWLIGEAGTGKETLARIVHFQGITRDQHFLKIDSAGLQPFLIRSMLFGQNGLAESSKLGTLFIRDPARLPPDLQSLLLDWYLGQDQPPRFVLSSREAPQEAIRREAILPDFWSVLAVQEFHLLPLRERKNDLPRLIQRLGERLVSPFPGLSPEVQHLCEGYDWPDNLRELHRLLSESLKQSEGKRIEANHLPNAIRERMRLARGLPPRPNSSPAPLPLESLLKQTELKLIQVALKRAKGNKTEAAEILGLNRTQLWRKLKDHGLEAD
jgi:DNA-binding NtrC family response regulator